MGTIVNQVLTALTSWIVDGSVEAWKSAAGWALGSGGLGDGEWAVTGDLLGKIAGIMAFLAVAAGAIGIVKAMVSGRLGDLFTSFAAILMAWPVTVLMVDVAAGLLTASDDLTTKVLGFDQDALDAVTNLDGSTLTSLGSNILAAIIAVLLIVSVIVLDIMMAARTILLILTIGMTPAATMLIGWPRMRENVFRWLSWVTGLILFKPIVAIVFYTSGKLMESAQGGQSAVLTYFAAIAGMIIASIAPWKLVRVFTSFMPGGQAAAQVAGTSEVAVKGTEKAAKETAQVAVAGATGGAGGAAAGAGAGAGGGAAGAGAEAGTAEGAAGTGAEGASGAGTGADAADGIGTAPRSGSPQGRQAGASSSPSASSPGQESDGGGRVHDAAARIADLTRGAAGPGGAGLSGAPLTAARLIHGASEAIAAHTRPGESDAAPHGASHDAAQPVVHVHVDTPRDGSAAPAQQSHGTDTPDIHVAVDAAGHDGHDGHDGGNNPADAIRTAPSGD